jgi:hypothetical protein
MPPKLKLTAAQLRVLRELCKPGKVAHRLGGGDPHWFLSGTTQRIPSAEDFIEFGLLTTRGERLRNNAYATPAAHALLAEIDGERVVVSGSPEWERIMQEAGK